VGVTLHRHEESHDTVVRHQRERHRPAEKCKPLRLWYPLPQKDGEQVRPRKAPSRWARTYRRGRKKCWGRWICGHHHGADPLEVVPFA
jgi:hypothetical protein